MFLKAFSPNTQAVDTAVTWQRSMQPMQPIVQPKPWEPASLRDYVVSLFTKPASQVRQELVEMDRHLQATTEKTKAHRAYDILEVVMQQLGCQAKDGCVIAPGVQILIFRAFDKAGYFTLDIPLDTRMSATATHLPPYVVSMAEYQSLMTEGCSRILLTLSQYYQIAFMIMASTSQGGAGVGDWWCKGNLFAYLLYIKHNVHGATYLPLVIADPAVATPETVTASLRRFLTKTKTTTEKPILFIIAADGVYSGSEATIQAHWWEKDSKHVGSYCAIITPVAVSKPPVFKNPIFCLSGTETETKSIIDVMHESKTKNKVPLLVAKCVPGQQSFVLPFKIADSASLGGYYSTQLQKLNPRFVPPYRKNESCDDLLHAKLTNEQQQKVHKRTLEAIDERLVSNSRKKRRRPIPSESTGHDQP